MAINWVNCREVISILNKQNAAHQNVCGDDFIKAATYSHSVCDTCCYHDIMWKSLTQVLFGTAQPKSGLHISHLNDIHTASPITHSPLNMPECDSPFSTFHKFEDGVLAMWCGFPTLASSSLNFKILIYQNVDQQNVLSDDLDNGCRTPQPFNVWQLWCSVLGLENLGGNGHPTVNNFPLLFITFWMNFPLLSIKKIHTSWGQAVNLQQAPVWKKVSEAWNLTLFFFHRMFLAQDPSPLLQHLRTSSTQQAQSSIDGEQILSPVRQGVTGHQSPSPRGIPEWYIDAKYMKINKQYWTQAEGRWLEPNQKI